MNKKDKKMILFLLMISLIGLVIYMTVRYFHHPEKGVVEYQEEVILEFDLNRDATYTFEGTYGVMHLEVKDARFHVYDVDCPNHNCEQQGWIDKESLLPIVCMPNEIVIHAVDQ